MYTIVAAYHLVVIMKKDKFLDVNNTTNNTISAYRIWSTHFQYN